MPPPRRGGGIRKHQQQRRDRDGDLVMGAAPRAAVVRPKPKEGSRSLTELKVTGWTDDKEIPKLTKFLDRHASKRSGAAKVGGMAATLIKRSKFAGEVLTISVRSEDAPAFGKINGFSFPSAHGQQKLTITGPGIRSRSPTDTAAASLTTEPVSETVELLKGFLERRYDPNTKLLNLSSITDDEQVNAVGMFASTSTQSKFVPVLMTIIDRQIKTADQKREAIQSVTLSNNSLTNLSLVRDLAITLPHIKNLDLSGNKIASTKDLLPWKNKLRELEHLILTGNPIETSQPGWEKEMVAWYPRLRVLNSQVVRTDAQIARIDGPKETPVPASNNLFLDGDSIATNFLIDFIQGFDNDRNALVQKYYDHDSTFTMSVNARAKGGAGKNHDKTPWDSYLPQSRNLKFIQNKRTRFNRKYRGPEQILKAFAGIPPTRHPELGTNKYNMDCQPQPGLPDPTGQHPGVTGLMLIIHGEYEEHRTAKGANEIVRRAFDRTFTLGPGGPSGVRVVSDMCCLRAAGGVPAWIPQETTTDVAPAATSATAPAAPIGLTPEQEAMVLQVHQGTKLTPEMAMQCLAAANWNLEQAAQLFHSQKDTLPPEAFVSI